MIKKLKNLEATFHVGYATIIVATFTLLSRITGLGREVLLASKLGTNANSDIYFTAFRLPDLVYNLLILGTLSVAFIPVFSEYYLKDKPRAFAIANTVLNLSAIGMFVICLIIFILVKPLTELIAPGFSPEQLSKTAEITRIMLLTPIIFTISNVFSSVLISLKKFLIVNTAPLLYNIGIIIGIIFFFPKYGLEGLAYGVILGALMHVLIQLPEALRFGYRWKSKLNYNDEAVKKIGTLFLPRIVGLDNSYVNLIIVSIIGSTLAAGSISAFNYANNIQAVALGIFALSSAVAVFPLLSEYYAKKDTKSFIETLQHTTIRVLYFIIPTTILILLLRAQIVRLLIGHGNCDWSCTIITFDTLGVLALGLIGQSLIPIFARAFYATQNTKTPVFYSLIGIGINIFLSYMLSERLGIVGVALGFAVAATIQSILLFAALHRRFVDELDANKKSLNMFDSTLIIQSLKILLASLVLGLVSYGTLYLVDPILNTHTVLGIFVQAGLATTTGGIVYIALTRALHVSESKTIAAGFFRVLRFITGKKVEPKG